MTENDKKRENNIDNTDKKDDNTDKKNEPITGIPALKKERKRRSDAGIKKNFTKPEEPEQEVLPPAPGVPEKEKPKKKDARKKKESTGKGTALAIIAVLILVGILVIAYSRTTESN